MTNGTIGSDGPIRGGSVDETLIARRPGETFLRWDTCGATNLGRVRKINEDAFYNGTLKRLWVVADGMGGHAAGDVASTSIVEAFREMTFSEDLSGFAEQAETALLDLNHRFRDLANSSGTDPGTTIGSTVAVLAERQNWLLCLWAGDSRIYRWRDGALLQLTQDHSQIEELISNGHLPPEAAETHPAANIVTRAIGGADELYVDLDYCDAMVGDRFLLCSDGLSREVASDEIADILARDCPARDMCDALIGAALADRARDNVTVLVVRAMDLPPNRGHDGD